MLAVLCIWVYCACVCVLLAFTLALCRSIVAKETSQQCFLWCPRLQRLLLHQPQHAPCLICSYCAYLSNVHTSTDKHAHKVIGLWCNPAVDTKYSVWPSVGQKYSTRVEVTVELKTALYLVFTFYFTYLILWPVHLFFTNRSVSKEIVFHPQSPVHE